MKRWASVFALAAVTALGTAACRQDMHDQPRLDPLEGSVFFADGRAARPLPMGVVAREHLDDDAGLFRGVDEKGRMLAEPPIELSRAVLERGRQRYDIYCSPCHARTGEGNGMIVQRGYPRPTSFHEQRLRNVPAGYMFSAITNGFGVMPSYAAQIAVEDRWAIVAYLRALQLSRTVPLDALGAADLDLLRGGSTAANASGAGHGQGHE